MPLDKMQEDPALDWMLKQQAVFTWYGDDRFVIGYPVVRFSVLYRTPRK